MNCDINYNIICIQMVNDQTDSSHWRLFTELILCTNFKIKKSIKLAVPPETSKMPQIELTDDFSISPFNSNKRKIGSTFI